MSDAKAESPPCCIRHARSDHRGGTSAPLRTGPPLPPPFSGSGPPSHPFLSHSRAHHSLCTSAPNFHPVWHAALQRRAVCRRWAATTFPRRSLPAATAAAAAARTAPPTAVDWRRHRCRCRRCRFCRCRRRPSGWRAACLPGRQGSRPGHSSRCRRGSRPGQASSLALSSPQPPVIVRLLDKLCSARRSILPRFPRHHLTHPLFPPRPPISSYLYSDGAPPASRPRMSSISSPMNSDDGAPPGMVRPSWQQAVENAPPPASAERGPYRRPSRFGPPLGSPGLGGKPPFAGGVQPPPPRPRTGSPPPPRRRALPMPPHAASSPHPLPPHVQPSSGSPSRGAPSQHSPLPSGCGPQMLPRSRSRGMPLDGPPRTLVAASSPSSSGPGLAPPSGPGPAGNVPPPTSSRHAGGATSSSAPGAPPGGSGGSGMWDPHKAPPEGGGPALGRPHTAPFTHPSRLGATGPDKFGGAPRARPPGPRGPSYGGFRGGPPGVRPVGSEFFCDDNSLRSIFHLSHLAVPHVPPPSAFQFFSPTWDALPCRTTRRTSIISTP